MKNTFTIQDEKIWGCNSKVKCHYKMLHMDRKKKELVGEIWTAKTNVKNGNNSWNVPSLSVL